MADTITAVNSKITGFFSGAVGGINWMNVLGWFLLVVILIGAGIWYYIWWNNKKVFTKKITVFEIVGNFYSPAFRDTAKVVKLGTGGFEILYLKKAKTWKIAYGGKVGADTYYFFIQPDGYWFNGMLSANMNAIDRQGGLIPLVTTNPSMRAQYTALEKQIDSIHKDAPSFMTKYGVWLMAAGYIAVMGIFFWLIAKEIGPVINNLASVADRQGDILNKLAQFAGNLKCQNPGAAGTGLVPI
jgi:hypothetical protein